MKKTNAIIYLGLTKAPGEKAWINGVSYVPLYMLSSPWKWWRWIVRAARRRKPSAPREAFR